VDSAAIPGGEGGFGIFGGFNVKVTDSGTISRDGFEYSCGEHRMPSAVRRIQRCPRSSVSQGWVVEPPGSPHTSGFRGRAMTKAH